MPTTLKQVKVTLLDPEVADIEATAKREEHSVSNEVRIRLGYAKLDKGPKGPRKKGK